MTTSTAHPSPFRASARVPLRIQLDNGYRSGPLDGGWWPQSRDLATECRDLVDHFPHLVGRPSRLLFSRPDWEDGGEPPVRRLPVASGVVKVGSFPGDDTHEMVLVMSSRERLRLLVVPHDVPAETAHRLLLEASGNAMLAQLASTVEEVLRGRAALGLTPAKPAEGTLENHVATAAAISASDAHAAEAGARTYVSLVALEVGDPVRGEPPREAG